MKPRRAPHFHVGRHQCEARSRNSSPFLGRLFPVASCSAFGLRSSFASQECHAEWYETPLCARGPLKYLPRFIDERQMQEGAAFPGGHLSLPWNHRGNIKGRGSTAKQRGHSSELRPLMLERKVVAL